MFAAIGVIDVGAENEPRGARRKPRMPAARCSAWFKTPRIHEEVESMHRHDDAQPAGTAAGRECRKDHKRLVNR